MLSLSKSTKNSARKIMIFKAKLINLQNTDCQNHCSKRTRKMIKRTIIDLLLNNKKRQNQRARNWFIILMMNLNMN